MNRPTPPLKIAGLIFVFLWFFSGGIGHFVITDFFTNIVPPYIPYPREVVYLSGVIEILLAFAIWPRRTRAAAGVALIVLICAVSLANIHMWQHPELFPSVPSWALSLRLVIQVFLLWVVWKSTRPEPRSRYA